MAAPPASGSLTVPVIPLTSERIAGGPGKFALPRSALNPYRTQRGRTRPRFRWHWLISMRVRLKALLLVCFLTGAGIALVLQVQALQHRASEQKVAQAQPGKVDEKKADTLRQIQSLVERVFHFQKITPKIN